MAKKRKRKPAPRYEVSLSMKAWDIAKAGAAVKFKIKDRNGLLGTIEIGQGTFGWKPNHGRKFVRVPWRSVSEWFNN